MTPSLFQDYFPNIDAAREQIRELYRRDDDRAFYVSFSGGKDSSLLLQLVYEVARAEYNGRKIFVTYNDTGVEERAAVEQLKNDAELIAATGKEINLSFQRCLPVPKYRFFATLIGCGYPTPSFSLRWCTKSLKVYPYSRFISATCKDFGGGYILDGRRKAESNNRKRVLAKFNAPEGFYVQRKNPPVVGYSPLADVSTESTFEYLYRFETLAFGKDVAALRAQYDYKNNKRGRVGCWCCTLCGNAKLAGDDPLKTFTRFLKEFGADPKNRGLCATEKQLKRQANGFATGRFNLDARKEILKRLLETQEKVGYELISQDEIDIIKGYWDNYNKELENYL